MSLRRRKMVQVAADQELLCYRDSVTGTLFTWECAPRKPIKIFRRGKEPLEFNIYPTMEKFLSSNPAAESPWAQWGVIVGVFGAFCRSFDAMEDDIEDQVRVDQAIKEIEKNL